MGTRGDAQEILRRSVEESVPNNGWTVVLFTEVGVENHCPHHKQWDKHDLDNCTSNGTDWILPPRDFRDTSINEALSMNFMST